MARVIIKTRDSMRKTQPGDIVTYNNILCLVAGGRQYIVVELSSGNNHVISDTDLQQLKRLHGQAILENVE